LELTAEEKILNKFGANIKDTETEVFDSKYIAIYNELKKHYKISQAMKAGSLSKGTKIEFYGDLDLTFTVDKPEIKDADEFRKDLERKMKVSFPKDEVKLQKVSCLIKFKNSIKIDVVYLPLIEYNKNKDQIKHIKSVNNNIKNIIRLVKWWNYKYNKKKFKSYKIEFHAIYSSASIYSKRIKDTIHKSGGGNKTNDIFDVIKEDAKSGKK